MIDFDSWGKFPKVSQKSFMINEFENLSWKDASEYFLPRGHGRSYGDSCLIKDGTLLVTLKKDRFIEFDQIAGVIKCESGVLLSDILEIAVPRGWFLPVTPGTQYVTVGGAIANDVHGKNHHVAGSFGRHIKSFHMIRSDGQELTCLPGDEWFSATVAGLGLTGLIVWAEIQLLKIDTPLMQCFSKRFENIDSFLKHQRNTTIILIIRFPGLIVHLPVKTWEEAFIWEPIIKLRIIIEVGIVRKSISTYPLRHHFPWSTS